ncbi:hypothetical protein SAMN04488007_2474 [Maribacter aquivivus]|uniref:BNR repeat-like domain-containing protein n=1 Tax=Maribacter aquivivus TaxID=228958 RepID=A0A1M6QU23_9FLAO|nr:hypothetical protein [Maribacter aquivivus]SHK23527.1 hypothetical protein SAMN04488007_2474 [Maribacter aquivivus]
MRNITNTFFIFSVISLMLGCKEETKNIQPEAAVSTMVEMSSPAGDASALPHLMSNKDVALLSWVEISNDTVATMRYSELIDGEWQEAQNICSGTDWFVNWADYPMITENNGSLWSHVLKKSTAGTYSYDVKMNVKPKGATDWKTDVDLHTDGTPTEHGFVSIVPYNNNFFVNWLDGRNTVENESGERGAMTLRGGVVSTTGELLEEYELDNSTCDCCQTTSVITDNGPVVVYRDRSDDEIRDISIVRQVKGEWTAPKVIHKDDWQIKGCPVNGPKVDALGNNLVVAWFTGASNKQKVQIAFSSDGGAEFLEPVSVVEGAIMGRVDILWMDEDQAVVSWMEANDKTALFNAMLVHKDGTTSKKQLITAMADSRKSGFPQMEMVEETLYFAWTEQVGAVTQVRTAKMSVDEFSIN